MFRKNSGAAGTAKQPLQHPVSRPAAPAEFDGPDKARLKKQLGDVRLKRRARAHHAKLMRLVPEIIALKQMGASLAEIADWCDTHGVKTSITTIRRLLPEKETKT